MAENTNTEVIVQEQKTAASNDNKVTDFSLGIFGSSNNFIMARNMADALSKSTIIPKEYQGNMSNCIVAIEQAVRLQVSPMMVMQNLYVIQGRPSWSSKFLIAAINGSGKFDMELQFEEKKDSTGKPLSCLAWTTKNGRRVEGMTVDMEMAKAEGWLSKNGSKWRTMPQLMLRYRAASFFSSLNCPELTLGLYTREEAEEMETYATVQSEEIFDPFEAKRIVEQNENSNEDKPDKAEVVNVEDGEQISISNMINQDKQKAGQE